MEEKIRVRTIIQPSHKLLMSISSHLSSPHYPDGHGWFEGLGGSVAEGFDRQLRGRRTAAAELNGDEDSITVAQVLTGWGAKTQTKKV